MDSKDEAILGFMYYLFLWWIALVIFLECGSDLLKLLRSIVNYIDAHTEYWKARGKAIKI